MCFFQEPPGPFHSLLGGLGLACPIMEELGPNFSMTFPPRAASHFVIAFHSTTPTLIAAPCLPGFTPPCMLKIFLPALLPFEVLTRGPLVVNFVCQFD